ncbi:CAP domain-containing protein, partial [Cetobacterium sp.]|uniref:CAP domain-containing protein n=1 Tax=Cetobacterium sp. TaxID=2071632 RepID=UPI003F3C676D
LNATPIINPTSTTSSTNPTQVKPISHTTTTTKPEHHEDHNTTNPVVNNNNNTTNTSNHHNSNKPVVEKVTKTVVTAEVMCDGKEVNGAGSIFCINSTGEFNGVNMTGGTTRELPVGTITGGELTTAPNGYNAVIGANKVETYVKGNTRYITIISQVTKDTNKTSDVKPETTPNKTSEAKPEVNHDKTTNTIKPEVVKPVVVKPAVAKPETTKPAEQHHETKPETTKPAEQHHDVNHDKTTNTNKPVEQHHETKPEVVKPAVVKPVVVKPVVKPAEQHHETKPEVVKPVVVKPAEQHHETKPAKPEVVKPVVQDGIINVSVINQDGQLVGSVQQYKGEVGSVTGLAMPTIPSGYKVGSITDNGTNVVSLPSTYKLGTQDVVIHIVATEAPVRVEVVANGVVINTVNHTMKVGQDLTDGMIPAGLNQHYTIESIKVDGQATGKTVSGTVQAGQNVIVINVAKKETQQAGTMQINSQEFNQIFANTVCQEVNSLRAHYAKVYNNSDITPLTETSLCNQAAEYKAKDMDITGLTHVCSNGETLNEIYQNDGPSAAGMGANLGGLSVNGSTGTAAYARQLAHEAVNLWMSSAAHEANLLSQGFENQGASVHFFTNKEGSPSVWVVWTSAGVNTSQINFQ